MTVYQDQLQKYLIEYAGGRVLTVRATSPVRAIQDAGRLRPLRIYAWRNNTWTELKGVLDV